MGECDPRLIPLLESHGLSWELFNKRGRPPVGVSEKRRAIVSELHRSGLSWDEMGSITGKSIMFIQRNTDAVGCEAAQRNRKLNAARSGVLGKGRKKPWLSDAMKASWEDGAFDFHKGRVRPPEERAKLKASFTSSRRAEISKRMKRQWENLSFRTRLETFHRSPEERARKSKAQSGRIGADPEFWSRGKGAWVFPEKSERERVYARSTYEVAAFGVLDRDSNVLSYQFEKVFVVCGRSIRPDLLVQRVDDTVLIEVKAHWATILPPSHKQTIRLELARHLAEQQGWRFEIWTEKDVLRDVV